jgi:hypothetical protein
MTDWLGLAVIAALIVLALVAMSRLGGPREEISVEEFEQRARSGAFTRAGMFALQEVLDPKQVKAVAVQQDLKYGYYNKKRVPGDGDEGEDEASSVQAEAGGAAREPRAGGAGERAAESNESEERDA